MFNPLLRHNALQHHAQTHLDETEVVFSSFLHCNVCATHMYISHQFTSILHGGNPNLSISFLHSISLSRLNQINSSILALSSQSWRLVLQTPHVPIKRTRLVKHLSQTLVFRYHFPTLEVQFKATNQWRRKSISVVSLVPVSSTQSVSSFRNSTSPQYS